MNIRYANISFLYKVTYILSHLLNISNFTNNSITTCINSFIFYWSLKDGRIFKNTTSLKVLPRTCYYELPYIIMIRLCYVSIMRSPLFDNV